MMSSRKVTFEVATDIAWEQGDASIVLLGETGIKWPDSLPEAIRDSFQQLVERKIWSGKRGEVQAVPTHGLLPVSYVLLAGLGKDEAAPDSWRAAGVFTAKQAGSYHLKRLTAVVDQWAGTGTDELTALERLGAFAEGLVLGHYRMITYRQKDEQHAEQLTVTVSGHGWSEEFRQKLSRRLNLAVIYAEATNYARDLTNMPGNRLIPEDMAKEAKKLASAYGFTCIVHDELDIMEMGMYGLHHVGKGSANPPRMIVLQYNGAPSAVERTGLVGKGITFDTGGISLKDPDGMEEMISDMGGAAVLLGVMEAVGRLKPPINVTVVIPAAENMPSGNALKPGDVISTFSGRTVEVLNTDAEGRIVLGDGITYAKKLGATRIVDIATLTGAILISLGNVATGAVTNHEPFLAELLQAAKVAGEKVWPLPSYQEYWDMLESEVADIRNSTGSNRWAGAITGGLFAGVFAEETPWIHLDTGGTAWLWDEKGIEPKGGTGAMVRTLLRLLCDPST